MLIYVTVQMKFDGIQENATQNDVWHNIQNNILQASTIQNDTLCYDITRYNEI